MRRRLLETLTVAVVLVGVALVGLVVVSRGSDVSKTAAVRAPRSPRPALAIPTPRLLASSGAVARWSRVLRAVSAREAPQVGSPVVAALSGTTPEGTSNLVLVIRTALGRDGMLWSKVRLPVLPNNTSGWVPRAALGPTNIVDTRLVVDLRHLRATLYRGGRAIFRAADRRRHSAVADAGGSASTSVTASPATRSRSTVRSRSGRARGQRC